MKKLYLILVICVILMPHIASSQCLTRTTTTRWDAVGTSNTWNWTTEFYTAYIKNRPYTTIPSPFYNPNSTFQNPNLIFLQSPATKDMDPEDGWELLVKDLGNNSNLPATAVTNPFFALYNRYNATIRVFFMVIDPLSGDNNGATVSLMFDGGSGRNETSLMSHAYPVISPLDRFEKGVISRMPNKYSNEYDYWLFADFPTSYDPCTCLFNSQITFTVQLISTTNASLDIKLTGTTTGTIKQVITPSPGGVQTSLSSNSVVNWVNGLVKQGAEAYKSWGAFQTAVTNFQDILITGNPEKKLKITQALSSLLGFTKELPEIGGLFGVFDFLIGGGKKAAKSAGPMAFNANFKHEISGSASGTLELSTVRGFRTIHTPGSDIANTSSGIASYDNVLGIFALLETPRIEYLQFSRQESPNPIWITLNNPWYDPNCAPPPDDPEYCGQPQSSLLFGLEKNKIRQFKLASPIKYAINPAANMTLIDVKAAVVIVDTGFIYGNDAVNFSYQPPYANAEEKFHNLGYEYETDFKVRTPFLPLTCIGNTSIAQQYNEWYAVPPKYHDNVFVKIKAIFRRNDAGPTTQDVIFIGTYKTIVSRSPSDPGNLTFNMWPTNRYNADGSTAGQIEYPSVFYFSVNQQPFPSPIPGVAGVQNPGYPGYCSGTVPPQTEQEITAFCNNRSLYNPVASSARVAFEDAVRPKENDNVAAIADGMVVTNFPNPFEKKTTITFSLFAGSVTRVYVTNQNGQLVKVLVDKYLGSGKHTVTFDGEGLTHGVYYYTVQNKDKKITKKILKLK